FFFPPTATSQTYTLSLHDALPILQRAPVLRHVALAEQAGRRQLQPRRQGLRRTAAPAAARPSRSHGAARLRALQARRPLGAGGADRKSTRLNSSHVSISYAVFCLK